MKTTQKFLAGVIAASALISVQVQAQQQYNGARGTPRIEGFNVDEVRHLAPGIELDFSIYGTPGGQASLRIEGATRNLTLMEVEPGQYEGTYTINGRDRIGARSPVTANLRVGNQVASTVLNESLEIGVGQHNVKAMAATQVKIERFSVEPVGDLGGGNDLRFHVQGTPGAKADLSINGVRGKVLLSEVRSGEYAGSYTIRNRDRITPNTVVTANLRVGDYVTSSVLAQTLQSTTTPQQMVCGHCGTVEAVNLIEVKGEGSYLGTIGGGLVGALLGSQVGGGNGRTVAEVAGAVGGAYAGRSIEANSRNSSHYEVVAILQNNTRQTVSFATDPGYRVGDKVKINDGVMSRNP
jgi:outer membrane lipoprotein SlyB